MHLSDCEWKVLDAVWQAHPATVRDVMDRLAGRSTWAYTTVKTMLTRLVDKGALESRKQANTTFYTPLISREEARRLALHALRDRAFDGAFAPLVEFVLADDELSGEDRAALVDLVRREAGAAMREV